LKNDCEKGAGVDLAKKYEVKVYPTFAMVNEAGEVTDRWAGYGGVEPFIAQVDAARADRSTIAQKKEDFAQRPTLALARSLAQYSEAVFASTDAVDYYRKILALDPASASDTRAKVFMAMYYGVRTGQFTSSQLLAEGEAILNDPAADVESVLMVTSVARQAAPPEDYVPILKQALAATDRATDPRIQGYRRELKVDEALLIQKDKPRALALKRETLVEGWQDDPAELNSFAWWCFENDLNLDEAYTLALKGAGLATEAGDKANILDTAAEIAFKLGRVDQAIEHETEAVKLAPDRAALQKTLERFQAAKD